MNLGKAKKVKKSCVDNRRLLADTVQMPRFSVFYKNAQLSGKYRMGKISFLKYPGASRSTLLRGRKRMFFLAPHQNFPLMKMVFVDSFSDFFISNPSVKIVSILTVPGVGYFSKPVFSVR